RPQSRDGPLPAYRDPASRPAEGERGNLGGRHRHFRHQDGRTVDSATKLEVACRLERREHVDEVARHRDLGDRLGDLTIPDHEAYRPAAVVPGHSVDALPDQLDHKHGFGNAREQVLAAARAGLHEHVARRSARRAADASSSMTGGLYPELPRRRALDDPLVQHPRGDEFLARYADPLRIERTRPEAAPAERIVDDVHAGPEYGLPQLVEQEAGLAGDRRAGDRAGKMAEQGGRDPLVEDHRIFAGLRAGRVQSRDGSLAGLPP